MKTITLASLLTACAGLLFAASGHAQSGNTGVYSLKTVEAKPIPEQEHFRLWREVALKMCDDAKRYNLTRAECLRIVSERADRCAGELAGISPDVIRTSEESRNLGRHFLWCTTPYYFCNGVEVKTPEEVVEKCK